MPVVTADLNRQPTVPITHNLRPAEDYFAVLTGKRVRNALTNTMSSLLESNSSGENPRQRANRIAVPIRTAVMTRFGQALRAHWADHVSCIWRENGNRYGIGH